MIPLREKRREVLLDLIPLIAVWVSLICAFALKDEFLRRSIAILTVIYGPLLASVYAISLMRVRILRLADRKRRQELAVTLLPALTYMQWQIRRPLSRLSMPALTVVPVSLGLNFSWSYDWWECFGSSLMVVGLQVWTVFCAMLAVLDMLIRFSASKVPTTLSPLISLWWCTILFGCPILVAVFFNLVEWPNAVSFYAVGAAFFLIFPYGLWIIVRRKWVKACMSFYEFD